MGAFPDDFLRSSRRPPDGTMSV